MNNGESESSSTGDVLSRNLPARLPDGGSPSVGTDVPFYPRSVQASDPDYLHWVSVRTKIVDVVRNPSQERERVVDDIADALLNHDRQIPTGLAAAAQTVFLLGKNIREKRKKREQFRQVVRSLLEQIFDPVLDFRMTAKDILDAFEANDVARSSVSSEQIGQVYVKVIHKLRVGELRDLTYEEELNRYVQLKLSHIQLSRQDWELNHR